MGLRAAGLSLGEVMDAVRKFPPDRLNDQPPAVGTPPSGLRKYAVVIKGEGVYNDDNRFETLEEAQAAQKVFLGLIRGERFPDDPFVVRLDLEKAAGAFRAQ